MLSISVSGQVPASSPVSSVVSVSTLDALAGAGKSRAAVEYVGARVMAGDRFLIAGPTLDQSKQWERDLLHLLGRLKHQNFRAPGAVKSINAETVRDADDMHVGTALAAKMASAPDPIGNAVCVTHAALLNLPRAADTGNWHLIIDEVPPVVVPNELTLPNAVADALRFSPGQSTMNLDRRSLHLEQRRLSVAARAARAGGDTEMAARLEAIANPLRELSRRLATGHWRVLAHVGAATAAPIGGSGLHGLKPTTTASGQRKVLLVSIIDWRAFLGAVGSRWKSVTIMAANIADSFVGQTLRMQGIETQDHTMMGQHLRYRDQHPGGERLTLLHALSKGRMSKRKRDTIMDENGVTFGGVIAQSILDAFEGQPFAWSANPSVPNEILPGGERMPFTAHGLNSFMHHDRVAVLNVARLSSDQMALLEQIGFTREAVDTAIMAENVYQAVMRSAMRNPDDLRPVTAVVPDRACADYIAARVPGCSIGALGSPEPPVKVGGRPIEYEDGKVRKAQNKVDQRERDRARRSARAANLRDDCLALTEPLVAWPVHLYDRINAAKSSEQKQFSGFDDMANWLATLHGRTISGKDQNFLLLAGEVPQLRGEAGDGWPRNSDGTLTFRAKANIVGRWCLWFDIENLQGLSGAPISVAEFKRIFAGLRMVIYSSASHRGGAPAMLRYRVVIPLSCAVGVLTYETLMDLAADRCTAAGWLPWRANAKPPGRGIRYSGIDSSKRSATSIFYAPATVTGFEADAFFEDIAGDPLDVQQWLADDTALLRILPDDFQPVTEIIAVSSTTLTGPERQLLEHRVGAAMNEYLAANHGGQNDGLFRLGWRLAGYGLCLAEIERRLYACAVGSHSPEDRRLDVPRIVADIRRRKGIA